MASSSQTEKDLTLRVIYNELGRATFKWFKIGIHLGIPHYKLQEFKKEDDPLSAVIDYWLAGNVLDSYISWKSIVAALEANSVGEPGLAKHINEKYCQEQVGDVPSIKPERNKQQEDGEGSQTQPSLSPQLDPDVKMDLKYILEENLHEICVKYASYVDCLREMIKDKPVSPEDLRSYLLSLPAFSKDFKGQNRNLLSDQKTELTKKNTINEIFDFLNMKCASFLHYDIFDMIMKKFKISVEKEELQYCDHLKAYVHKHKISEFLMVNPLLKNEKADSNKLILKFDVENTCELAKVNELKMNVAKILKLKPSALQIIDIKEGCVVVTFHIPTSVASVLFTQDTMFTLQQEDELRAASVDWLQCNGYTFNIRKMELKRKDSLNLSGLRKLKEQLTCSICLGTYTDPKLLQCSHSFCQQCLLGLRQPHWLAITCPTCRHVTPIRADGVAGLPSDFRSNQLLDILDENWKDTANFKSEVDQISSPVNSNPVNFSSEASPTTAQICCPEHEKDIQLYCETCTSFVCLRCVVKGGEHHNHDWEDLDQTFEKRKQEVPKLLEVVEKALANFEVRRNEIFDQAMAIESAICNTILPDGRKLELSKQLQYITKVKLKKLAVMKDSLDTTQLQLNQILRMPTIVTLIAKSKTVEQVNELACLPQQDWLKPSVEANTKLSDIVDVTAECQRYGLVSPEPPDLPKVTDEGAKLSTEGDKSSVVLHKLDFNNQPYKRVITSQLPIRTIDGVVKPTSIAVNYNGEIVVIEREGRCVTTFSPTGERLQSFSTTRFGLGSMSHRVAVNDGGTIFVADAVNRCTQLFTPQGRPIEDINLKKGRTSRLYPREIAFNDKGWLNNPQHVACDSTGNVYAVDWGSHCVQVFTAHGEFLRMFGRCGELIWPYGVTVDALDRVYISKWDNHSITVFTSEGKPLTSFGGKGSEQGQFKYPCGLATDSSGAVYVCDNENNRIQVFRVHNNIAVQQS